jgi:hypothetical protein
LKSFKWTFSNNWSIWFDEICLCVPNIEAITCLNASREIFPFESKSAQWRNLILISPTCERTFSFNIDSSSPISIRCVDFPVGIWDDDDKTDEARRP